MTSNVVVGAAVISVEPLVRFHFLADLLTRDRRWINSRRPHVKQCDGRYLCDSEELKAQFRESFLAGLRRLHTSGELSLNGDWEHLQSKTAFDDWLKPLESITWVVYIEPPPYEHCPPEQVAKYLARYLTGGPISDRRIVSHEDGCVTFLACVGKRTGGDDEVEPIRLRGAEFVRRWSLHILPKCYTKTRRFGGYWNGRREAYIAECRALLAAADVESSASPAPAVSNPAAPTAESQTDTTPCCPKCKAKMRWIGFDHKRGWRIVMHSLYRPHWYRDD